MTAADHRDGRGVAVVVVVTARPGAAELLRTALEDLAPVTRTQPACLSYTLHRSCTDPATFVTVEQWIDEPSLQAYLHSAAVAAAGQAMAGMLVTAPVMHVLDVLAGPMSGIGPGADGVPLSRTSVAMMPSQREAEAMTSSNVVQDVDRRIPAHQVDTKLAELQPDISAAFTNMRSVAWASTDPRILELCRIRLAQLLGDDDAAALRTPAAIDAGLDEDQLSELDKWDSSARFSDVERAHLAFTEQFNLAVSSMQDDDVAALRALESEDEIGRFAMALYVVEMEMRMRMIARRVLRTENNK